MVNADNWEEHWQKYAASAKLNPAQTMRHRAILAALRLARPHSARLIDVGSGQGDFLERAMQAGVADRFVGFELSETGVRISKQKLPSVDFLQVDLFAPTPAAEPYFGWATAAVCSDVIEHVDDPVAFLRALRTYLADDATLVLTVPGGPMSRFDKHIGHRQHFSDRLVRSVLTEAGFEVDFVWMAGFPFFNLYRLMVIMRGAQLINDVEAGDGEGARSGTARIAMAIFGLLFRLNVRTSRFGWQVVAVARRTADERTNS